MKIINFDRATARRLQRRVDEALFPLAEEFGISITTKGGKFSSASLVQRIEFATVGEGGVVNDRDAESFKRSAIRYGLEADDLGREFFYSGKTYRVVGLRTKSRKYPVIAENVVDGRKTKFPADAVKSLLAAA